MDATAPEGTRVPQPTLLDRSDGACELLLIRHGRSADVIPGSPEAADPGLHPDGRDQVAALARRLDHKPIDAVYASHLLRAVETASALAEPRGLDVQTDADLQEVLLGDWGLGEFRRRAAVQDPDWVAWSRTRRWDGVPGGEGDDALRQRVVASIERLAEEHRGGTIAVVVHAGVINAYLAEVFGLVLSLWLTVENTSITVVRAGVDGHHLVVANDCHHLYDPVLGVREEQTVQGSGHSR
jgi:2,3-bisphosphoglycerate-dependent phosphoglycerate mutase